MPLRVWYDALTGLAELHRAYPQNHKINDDWASLLQSVGGKAGSRALCSVLFPEN